jgi:hypothetical protein
MLYNHLGGGGKQGERRIEVKIVRSFVFDE